MVIFTITQICVILFTTSFKFSIISSNSMNPTLVKGDIIIWTPSIIEDINKDDIVVYKSYIKWPNQKLIAHRVTNVKSDKISGKLMLETKGDANGWIDQDNPNINVPYIKDDFIQGKAVCFNNQPLKININSIYMI